VIAMAVFGILLLFTGRSERMILLPMIVLLAISLTAQLLMYKKKATLFNDKKQPRN